MPTVGIIAEDESDVNSARILIHRIAENNRIEIKKFVGGGCGKLRRKCSAWSHQLHQKGCSILIIIHDLDRNILSELNNKIQDLITPCPIRKNLICIPVQEFEAWFLSDLNAIQKSLKLRKTPKMKGYPENIHSPKETLGRLILKASDGEKDYINTTHNEIIAAHLSIEKAKRICPSFRPFNNFIVEHLKQN